MALGLGIFMIAEVNMVYSHYTNLIGMLVCVVTAVCCKWRFKERNKENNVLLYLLVCVFVSCMADSLAVWADGRAGDFWRIVVYLSNTWMFIACIMNGFLWILFIEEHIKGKNSDVHVKILQTIIIVSLLILVINMYLPIVFAVNGNNVYERKPLFFLYMVIQLGFMFDAITMYMIAKYKMGGLSVYQIWLYIMPLFVGMVAQLLVYGTSLIWPSAAVSTAVLFWQFGKEDRYKDSVTRLFRYDYLPVLNEKLKKFARKQYTVIVIQVLGLPNVRNTFGMKEEDNARLEVANIFNRTIKPKGVIVQCEGDAFAIVLNEVADDMPQKSIKKLEKEFEEFNKLKKMEYALTVSFGQGVVDLNNGSIADVVEELRETL